LGFSDPIAINNPDESAGTIELKRILMNQFRNRLDSFTDAMTYTLSTLGYSGISVGDLT